MSDTMKVQPFSTLLRWIVTELNERDSVFGLPRALFFVPRSDSPYGTESLFGFPLATPIGPAAGPHTQLAQNIVASWLSGGRFIELKTVQIMDELKIPRPCIDMEDEGYNVEWSQELKLEQSAHEYINAWALIHVLRRLLGFDGQGPLGTIFNMSVGYNLEGIQSGPMVHFMDRMEDASSELSEIRSILHREYPEFEDIEMPTRLTNSVTLSTMHGCPPDEIEQIARHLLEERGLHTIVKLNPTLLGQQTVMAILHDHLGYREITIPDAVFAHDLQYDRAVGLIRSLKKSASERGLFFGVKLSNTLAMANHRGALPGEEMYMSGRALYPLTINLFHRLVDEFDGDLNVSYAGGADALNVTTLLACGALPVTAASDLLKPGGYSRLAYWLERLEEDMRERGALSLADLSADRMGNLERAAAEALSTSRYKKSYFPHGLPKVGSGLELFDCVVAPCVEQCAVCQDVPEYAWLIAGKQYDRALELILHRNPLPGVTGYVCTHLCQTKCTRNNYDEPVGIRNLKRFAFERGRVKLPTACDTGRKVAIVGSGPSGLAAAFFLSLNGVRVTIFEAREMPGGMLAIAPHFRLPPAVVQRDIDRIVGMGAELRLDHRVSIPPGELLKEGFDAVYLACGFQEDASLAIEGIDGQGAFTALRFLEQVARGERPDLGSKVLVIGGGNTAMDAARTAQRLTGRATTVVYRRTRAEMPAERDELRDLFDEGNELVELATPRRVILDKGRVAALECVRNELGAPDASGRRRPVEVKRSKFAIAADTIILAIGQGPDLTFLDGSDVTLGRNGTIVADPETAEAANCVYAGGDVARGPAIIIQACADGRKAAESICQKLGVPFAPPSAQPETLSEAEILGVKRARACQQARHEPELLPVALRAEWDLVEQTLDEESALAEARRCLQCSTLCDKCVEVCPNRANFSYSVSPVAWDLPRLRQQDGELVLDVTERFVVSQQRQIIHVDDFCNECGNCATFCVHEGRPYAEKPRLFLDEDSFDLETDNAYHIDSSRPGDGICIRSRSEGVESRLTRLDGWLEFENPSLRLRLSARFEIDTMSLKTAFAGTLSLRNAAEMAVILDGLMRTAPFLLISR
jgi:putative selenate reductase